MEDIRHIYLLIRTDKQEAFKDAFFAFVKANKLTAYKGLQESFYAVDEDPFTKAPKNYEVDVAYFGLLGGKQARLVHGDWDIGVWAEFPAIIASDGFAVPVIKFLAAAGLEKDKDFRVGSFE